MAIILLLLVSRARAATYASRLDFTGTTLDCIKNNNLTGQVFYNHKTATCHAVEASWRGPFFTGEWGPLICQQGLDDNRCSSWGYGCCTLCTLFATNEHTADFNLGKAFAPGEYLQSLTVDREVTTADSTAPKPLDVTNNARFELAFSPTGFGDAQSCARQGVAAPPILNPGDVWNITVVIPDLGQSVKMDKDEPGSGDGQEMLAGTTSKPFKVIVTKKVGATTLALEGLDVVFRLKDAAGTQVGEAVTARTGADGRAQATFSVQTPGTYSVEATCAGCAGGSPAIFPFKALSLPDATVLKIQSMGKTGVAGEPRLRTPLVVQVVNKVDGKPMADIGFSVTFEMVPNGTCPTGTHVEASGAVTEGPHALAKTHIKPGATTGKCRIRAFCGQCLGGSEAFADFEIVNRPESEMDEGEPGNSFSKSGGGPPPVAARRKPGQFAIKYRLNFLGSHSFARPRRGFLAALSGDTLNYEVEPKVPGSFSWSSTAGGGSGQGPTLDALQSTIATDVKNPIVQSVVRDGGDTESVGVLIFPRPTGFATNTQDAGELVAKGATVSFCVARTRDSRTCKRLILAHNEAWSWAENEFKDRGRKTGQDEVTGAKGRGGDCHRGCCDAARHAYWHAHATFLAGKIIANFMGNEHEGVALFNGDAHNDIAMDLHSNSVGHGIGEFAKEQGLQESAVKELVKSRVLSGGLLVFWSAGDDLSLLVNSDVCKR